MTIGDICKFKTNFEEADFWLIRKGTESIVGKPVKQFDNEYIGVQVIDNSIIDPTFLFYYFQYMHQKGLFAALSNGVLQVKHISISDIKKMPIIFNKKGM